MSKIDIARLRELLAKATPGPWRWGDEHGNKSWHLFGNREFAGVPIIMLDPASLYITAADDTDLIAALVNAAPELLSEIERLQSLCDAYYHQTMHDSRTFADLEAKLAAAEARAENAEAAATRPTTALCQAMKRIAELEAEVTQIKDEVRQRSISAGIVAIHNEDRGLSSRDDREVENAYLDLLEWMERSRHDAR